jgi:hypothetical protein
LIPGKPVGTAASDPLYRRLAASVARHAIRLGYAMIKQIVTLYYTMRDADTPLWARTIIGAGFMS